MLRKLYTRAAGMMTTWWKQPPKVLGRWHMEEDNALSGKKADLSKEDHCGCDEMRSRYLYEKEQLERMVSKHLDEEKKKEGNFN